MICSSVASSSRTKFLLSFLLVVLLILELTESHFLWAEVSNANVVVVTFAEQAGVHDPIISVLADRITEMNVATSGKAADYKIPLHKENNAIVGQLHIPLMVLDKNSPMWVTGFLDYGPFPMTDQEPPPDLQYSFGAQVFGDESDFDWFLQRMMLDDASRHFSVIMKSCGPPYKFHVGGLEDDEAQVDVCLFQKGGLKLGCTSNSRHNLILTAADMLMAPLPEDFDAGSMYYALANTTITNDDDGKVTELLFASTSVQFAGPCTEDRDDSSSFR